MPVLVSVLCGRADEGGRKHSIATNYSPQFFLRSANVTGQLTLEGTGEDGKERPSIALPGDNAEFEVKLQQPILLQPGQRFTMREGKHTIASGLIAKIIE